MSDPSNEDNREAFDRVREELGFHPATEATADLHHLAREAALEFSAHIIALCPRSKERTVALNKAREAMMWANAAIAVHGAPLDPSFAPGEGGESGEGGARSPLGAVLKELADQLDDAADRLKAHLRRGEDD